jgi:hypothetical protein
VARNIYGVTVVSDRGEGGRDAVLRTSLVQACPRYHE